MGKGSTQARQVDTIGVVKSVLFCLSLLVVSSASAQKVAVPVEIKAIYDAQAVDLRKGDWKAFFSYYDPAFIVIGADGKKQTLAELRKEVESMTKATSKRNITIKFTGCKQKSGLVDVSYIADFEFVPAKGKPGKFREVGTDTWKKQGASWKEVKTVDKAFGPTK